MRTEQQGHPSAAADASGFTCVVTFNCLCGSKPRSPSRSLSECGKPVPCDKIHRKRHASAASIHLWREDTLFTSGSCKTSCPLLFTVDTG